VLEYGGQPYLDASLEVVIIFGLPFI
jgi:hypothetical protein